MHILQSKAWEKFEKLEGHKTFREKGDNFSILAVEKSTPLGKYLYLPYGPEMESSKSLSSAFKSLKKLANEQGALFARIEPTLDLSKEQLEKAAAKNSLKIKKTKHANPETTWRIDLTQSDEDLFSSVEAAKMKKWRNMAKKNLSIEESDNPEDVKILVELLAKIGEKDNFTPQDEGHLKNQVKSEFGHLYFVYLEEDGKKKPISAQLTFEDKDGLYTVHAASDGKYRNLQPGTLMIINLMKKAKAEGKKFVDFWGITTSNDPKHPWYGFTQYKKSFGGYQVDYTGTYDLVINSSKYSLYTMLRKVNLIKRKLIKK